MVEGSRNSRDVESMLEVDQYNICAAKYSEALTHHNQSSIAAYFRYFDFPINGKKVLDLGCGDGTDLSLLKGMGAIIFGLDASNEMVRLAKEKNPEGEIVLGTFENIPYDETFFDVVICKWALQTAFDIHAVYAEVARVLKKGGEFVFLTCHPIRQFIEKKRKGKNYFEQEIVESVFFDGLITAKEPSHTMNEYLSPLFFRYFSIDAYEEGHDPSAENVDGDIYPSFFIIKARRK